MSSYRFVEQIDDRLRGDLMELYRHEWWTHQRREDDVARMLEHTDLVVGVCADPGGRLVGFTRVLTDRVFKALIFDVIVARAHRGTGLGRRLIHYVLDHPMLTQVGHIELYCRPEMIPFYEQWGFSTSVSGNNLMRMERVKSALLLLLFIAFGAFASACDGGNTDRTPPAPPPPPTTAQNPCPASSLASSPAPAVDGQGPSKTAGRLIDGDPRGMLGDVLWRHEAARERLLSTAAGAPRAVEDVGEIAVIQDEGDLIAPPNTFDLQGTGLRYTPRTGGSYDVSRTDAAFRASIGDAVTLRDDDSASRMVMFGFDFYGRRQSAAFVNSDGNITFGQFDTAITARSVSRLLSGPPRIAPFFADLDPSAGGTVFIRTAADAFTVTWCGVRVFDSARLVTLQTSLFPDGTIEMKYAASPRWTAEDGIVAISPGQVASFTTVDLVTAATAALTGNTGAIGERFAARPDLDLVALSRKFYRTHGDRYDQLVVWTDDVMTPEGAFAFEVTVANDITGIGLERFNSSGQFGSAGQLGSVVQMDAIAKFPEDPTARFLGENSTVSVMGQEVGHRWLAFLRFSDHNRQSSTALLGRDESHWSFFFNSDASVMEGNRIQDLGGGNFRTVGAVERYSLLDQYAMGLVRDADVPPTFYVESPTNVAGNAEADSPPRVGVTFSGTRRDVFISDVIEVMGARQPSSENSPRVIRQAFLFVVSRGRTAAPADVAKIDRIRRAWETFFAQATSGRGRAETRLSAGT